MRGLAWFLVACLCWYAVSTPCFAAERQIARHQGLTASVDSGFGCARSASITVRAPEASAYTGDRIALQRLLGTVRAGLGADCPVLNELDVTGFADGDPVFQAAITADDDWRLPTGVGRILAENPLSPLARETARCDYERSDPFVGCWIGLAPERGRGMILNIRNDGTWYWDTPEKLAIGKPVFDGKEIVHNDMYFVGQLLTFVFKNGGWLDMVGPFFMAKCNVMKLNPYQLGGSQESQIFVRLHSPQWINANILESYDVSEKNGYIGNPGSDEIVESLPDDGDLFNNCNDNFDQDISEEDLFSLVSNVVPLGRFGNLFSRAFLKIFANRLIENNLSVAEIFTPNGIPVGSRLGSAKPSIRTVSEEQFNNILNNLFNSGAKRVRKDRYDGEWYQLPGEHGEFGIRQSTGSGRTMDINIPSIPQITKIHIGN